MPRYTYSSEKETYKKKKPEKFVFISSAVRGGMNNYSLYEDSLRKQNCSQKGKPCYCGVK